MTDTFILRVLTFKEGDTWIAQALEKDLCVQASSEDELRARFELLIDLECANSSCDDLHALTKIDAAPEHFMKMWMELEANNPIQRFRHNELNVEMATAA